MAHPKPTSACRDVSSDDIILVAQMVQRLRAGGDLRRSMIRHVRRAIRTGDYENPLKLDVAADRVVRELTLPEKHNADR